MALGASVNASGQSFPLGQFSLGCFFLQEPLSDWICSLVCIVLQNILHKHQERVSINSLGSISSSQIIHLGTNLCS
jgi:hypothetical protein